MRGRGVEVWLGVCGGIPRPPKILQREKKEGGGERIQSWVPSKLVEPNEMLKGDLQWIRIPSGGVTILLVTLYMYKGYCDILAGWAT